MPNPWTRTELLLGPDAIARLRGARVALFGLGGVGGYALEALARAGVGRLLLVDADTVSLTNLNRQILATRQTLGMPKTEAAEARVRAIDPDIQVQTRALFVLPENIGEIDFAQLDYVVDAVDTVAAKIAIVERAAACGVPVISCMGAGNKLDPSCLRVADLYDTSVCPLARVMRQELRRRGIAQLKVVYSTEKARVPRPLPEAEREPGGKRVTPGSLPTVPAVAGLLIASEVLHDLCDGLIPDP